MQKKNPKECLKTFIVKRLTKATFIGMLSLLTLPINTQASENLLTQTQLHAVLGVVSNFILDGITHNGTKYGIVTSPHTGRVWLDRNLGAKRVCTSLDDTQCYGDYYQWGRGYDGHQNVASTTIPTLATDIYSVGNGNFITPSATPNDWTSVDATGVSRQEKWSKTDGTNICPLSYRVPTIAELRAELLDVGSAQIQNGNDAFNSFLKLASAGNRDGNTGVLGSNNTSGYVWSQSGSGSDISHVYFGDSTAGLSKLAYRSDAYSVRCIKQINASEIVHHGTLYGTVTSPYTGKVWLDRNLGANRVCTNRADVECYGDYYQWGRGYDGHQDVNSVLTNTRAVGIVTAGKNFISTVENDWLVNSIDDNGSIRQENWLKNDGTSICPIGFKVPTSSDINQETIAEGVTDIFTAYHDFLKIPSAGSRTSATGIISVNNISIWMDKPIGGIASVIFIDTEKAIISNISMSRGIPVRCMKN